MTLHYSLHIIDIEDCVRRVLFSKNGPFLASFFFILIFSIQLTENKCSINFANDWIWTVELWYRKLTLYQLSYNHCPKKGSLPNTLSPYHSFGMVFKYGLCFCWSVRWRIIFYYLRAVLGCGDELMYDGGDVVDGRRPPNFQIGNGHFWNPLGKFLFWGKPGPFLFMFVHFTWQI